MTFEQHLHNILELRQAMDDIIFPKKNKQKKENVKQQESKDKKRH